MTRLVIGNWKMHGRREQNRALLQALASASSAGVDVAVCPSFPYLMDACDSLASTPIKVGGQDLSLHEDGAFTGEVSGAMLRDVGCRYVLVGHSERRVLHGESDTQVAEKFAQALACGLVPVLCVGETWEQRRAQETFPVIEQQVQAVLNKVGYEGLAFGVIAYEPIWAIGTGETATPEQAQAVHAHIRQMFKHCHNLPRQRLLYGGSVKAQNARALFACPDIDGALVGGASLDAESFLAICAAASITQF